MSANFNAELYASKTRTAHATLNGELYASGQFLYRADSHFDTEITYENDQPARPFTMNADTERNLYVEFEQNNDTEIQYTQGEPIELNFDTEICISNAFEKNFDTERELRVVYKPFQLNADTELKIQNDFEQNDDTAILIYQGSVNIEENFDTLRNLVDILEGNYDTNINTYRKEDTNSDIELKTQNEYTSDFDTKIDIQNERFKVFTLNGDTDVEIYKQMTHTYGIVTCRTIDLGDSYTIEAAISITGAGYAKIRYSNTKGGGGAYVDYKPTRVKCRYIDVQLIVRDRITAAKLQVIPVPREVTINEHIPTKGKTITFDPFMQKPAIFPAANEYTVKVTDITQKSAFVRLYNEGEPIEGDVTLLIKG